MNSPGSRKERAGLVVSDRMQKTVVVSVERTVMHPRYKKICDGARESRPMTSRASVMSVIACSSSSAARSAATSVGG